MGVGRKLVTLSEAIGEFVPDGCSVVMGTALESLIPFAAGHEIIRQGRKDLTLVGPISDILFDQLIGAGCVRRVATAWVGNVSAGLGHNYRRATEAGDPRPIEVNDHSNFTIGLGLLAGAMGVPYLPARTLLGSDIVRGNADFRVGRSPWNGERLLLVPALNPDVAILHVQRCDEEGNAHCWGNLGVSEEAALASRSVVLVAEEIVRRDTILSDPNRVLVPGARVAAVVHEPGGAHPSPVQGYYRRDHDFFSVYHQASRARGGFLRWLEEWVFSVQNRSEYLRKLGSQRWAALRAVRPAPAAPVDYGW